MSAQSQAHTVPTLTPEEGWELFDGEARRLMGMSGEEFLLRWNAGEYRDIDTSEVVQMYLLLSLAQHTHDVTFEP